MGGLALLILAGCGDVASHRAAVVPQELTVVVELENGGYASVLADLRRNPRREVDLRVAEGLVVYDGRRVWDVDGGDDGIAVRERASGMTEKLGVPGHVVRVADGRLWVDTGDDVLACSLRTRDCAPAGPPEPVRSTHEGPGPGFRVVSRDGRLVLLLPSEGDGDPGTAITGPYERIVAMHWITTPDPAVRPVLDRAFRGRASLELATFEPVVDGDLDEWAETDALVVDAPWQIEEGGDVWQGPRDASFSVAATRAAKAVCLAGRVRDDDVRDGDHVTMRLGPLTRDLPLLGPLQDGTARGEEWFGARYEACVELPPRLLAQPIVRFGIVFEDDDADGRTVLSAAPTIAGSPGGMLRASR